MSYDALEVSQYSGKPVELYRFTRGSTVWRFTDCDEPQTLSGEEYVSELVSRDEIDQSIEDWAGSINIMVPQDNPVATMFIPYLPIEPVGVTVYRRHRSDDETVPIFIGKIASAAFENGEAKLTAMPVGEALRRIVPSLTYQVPCNHALYSAGCGINKELFKETGPITAVSGDTIKCAAFASRANGWFTTGFAKLSNGDVRFIVAHTGDTITLMSPFPGAVVGDTITAYAGCNRTETTCETKFGNLVNHLGFARIPTINPYNTDISGMGGNGGMGGTVGGGGTAGSWRTGSIGTRTGG